MIRVKKIAHAVYEMPDVDKQTEYYTEVLGLTVTDKGKDAVYLASTVDHHSVVLRKGSQPKCVRLGFQIATFAIIARRLPRPRSPTKPTACESSTITSASPSTASGSAAR